MRLRCGYSHDASTQGPGNPCWRAWCDPPNASAAEAWMPTFETAPFRYGDGTCAYRQAELHALVRQQAFLGLQYNELVSARAPDSPLARAVCTLPECIIRSTPRSRCRVPGTCRQENAPGDSQSVNNVAYASLRSSSSLPSPARCLTRLQPSSIRPRAARARGSKPRMCTEPSVAHTARPRRARRCCDTIALSRPRRLAWFTSSSKSYGSHGWPICGFILQACCARG